MTPWLQLDQENIRKSVTESVLGVFQLSRNGKDINFVGRADEDLRDSLLRVVGRGYTHFQWVQVPWVKEGYEMHCRLYHLNGGKKLENDDHPLPPDGKSLRCPMSAQAPAFCEL